MFCSSCGNELSDDSKLCNKCGTSFQKEQNTYEISLIRTDPKGFSFLLLAMFFLNSSFLIKSIFLKMFAKPLPPVTTPVFTILTFIISIIFLLIYFKKTSGVELSFNNIKKTLFSSIFSILLSISFVSIFALITTSLYKTIVSLALNESGLSILVAIAYFLAVFILQYFVISSIMHLYISVRYSLPILGHLSAYIKTFSIIFKHLIKVTMINLGIFIIFFIMLLSQNFLTDLINKLQPFGFLNVFFTVIIWSLIFSYMLQLIFNLTSSYTDKNSQSFENIQSSGSKASLIFNIAILIPIIVLAVITYKTPLSPYDKITAEIQNHSSSADLMLKMGHTIGAVNEYDKALSKAYSLRGLLLGAKAINTNDSKISLDSRNDFEKALEFDLFNGYISLFNGNLLYMKESYENALKEFRMGLNNPLFEPEIFLGLLKTQKKLDKKDELIDTFDWLMRNEIYTDTYSSLYDLSLKKLDSLIEKTDDLITSIEPNLMFKYYEKIKFGDYYNASQGLASLREKYPANAQIRYYLSLIYAEYRDEARNYPKLLNEVNVLSSLLGKSSGDESKTDLDIFTAEMKMQANEYTEAEEIYKKLYINNKEDKDICETYMYLLIKNKKFEDALEISEEIADKKIITLKTTYLTSMALLNLGLYEGSLEKSKEMIDSSAAYTEEYDRLLYGYSLAYVNAIKTQEHIDLIDKVLANNILYDYILGLKGWKDKDSDTSNIYLQKVLNNDDRLGYAMYAIGVNYYEITIRTGSTDFSDAIEYYLASLDIIPDHFEGYFALGHCYKKAGRLKESLRAFRKVVDLVPYEDHRVDPYGIVVHAQSEIQKITSELEKEGY